MRLMEIELHEPDVNKIGELAVSGRVAGRMSEATRGKLECSLRYCELMRPLGFGDELRVACVDESRTWGAIVMHRELGRPDFAADDVNLLASLSGAFAEAFQRASLRSNPPVNGAPSDGEPGLLLLDHNDRIEMTNAAAAEWLDELREEGSDLPLVVTAVARQARAVASGTSVVAATARVRTASGRWAVVRGSMLFGEALTQTAVTIEPARVPEIAPLVVRAYGLTERERLVTESVAQGFSTATIARRLHLSPFTVQDHLKAIFEKLGVSSRGELVARLFLDHYQVAGSLSDPWQRERP
jgi:DNA-binding NarL/FixJ family response regulator